MTTFTKQRDVFTATREIGIDMGHRVTNHGSKCRNVHGHRYRVEVTVQGRLLDRGEEEGMVMDFSFLKDKMMELIDKPFDHGLALWCDDPLIRHACSFGVADATEPAPTQSLHWSTVIGAAREYGYVWVKSKLFGKVLVTADVPTAENLARLWFEQLQNHLPVELICVRVWETPNCYAEYRGSTP